MISNAAEPRRRLSLEVVTQVTDAIRGDSRTGPNSREIGAPIPPLERREQMVRV